MLNTLDTIIAFAVIMTVLSLLITIIVQMVSAALSLRGKSLANALSVTFQTIDPNIGKHAHSLAAQILRDPIFSDSMWRKKTRRILDDAAQEFLAAERKLRDANLKKPDDPTREWVISEARTEVEAARAGLTVPDVKPNREKPWGFWAWPWGGAMQIATAIRPGEIYRVLQELREMSPEEAQLRDIPKDLVGKAAGLIAVLQRWDQPAIESRGKLADVANLSKIFRPEQQKAVVEALANFGATFERATTQAYDRFQRWFGSAQDRAEQWFQTHVRIVTIVAAILITLLLQLDTVEIYRQLRDQPKLVEALVKAAPGVLEQGGAVVDPSDNAAYQTYRLWLARHPLFPLDALPTPATVDNYEHALDARIKLPPEPSYPINEFKKRFAAASTVNVAVKNQKISALRSAYDAWAEQYPGYKVETTPDFTRENESSLTQKLAAKVNGDAEAQRSANRSNWLAEFRGLQSEGVAAFQEMRGKAFVDLKTSMDKAGFNPVPHGWFARWPKEGCLWWFRHFVGLVLTAGLLTLGAPFWFNLLKNLMSLRPAVATLVEKRPTSAPALPPAPATPPSPS
ncbi:MAG: hypothetical protein ABR514_05385 [Chthoniobacterales bacterium]